MTDLAHFLLARIAEDEAVAVGVRDYRREREPLEGDAVGGYEWDNSGMVYVSPARVLAECEAKREMVEDLRDELANQHDPEPTTLQLAERTLLTLALPYADHPDYREEWRA